MTHLFEGINFLERRFDRADVRAITGLTDRQLDRWADRRVIPVEDQRPGKGGRRRYHGFEVFALKVMGVLTEDFRIPPGDAADLAKIVTMEIIKRSAEDESLMVDRLDIKADALVTDFAYMMLWYQDGDWQLLSDYQHPIAPMGLEIRRSTKAHISLPVTAMFMHFIADVCERVYGTEWTRNQRLALLEAMPIKRLRGYLEAPDDFILDVTGCTREDVEKHLAGRRRAKPKRKKS